MVDKKIFRQYDIRGVWGDDLTPGTALLIGRAFGTLCREVCGKEKVRLTIGRDVRLSSAAISET